MKKYKIFGYLFLVLLFSVFIPATNYQVFAKTSTTTHKVATVKKVKKSKVKKTKKTRTAIKTTSGAKKTSVAAASYTLANIATHNSATSCWTTIGGSVYNLTSWINKHPGGKQAILSLCGKDGTQAFNDQHGGQAKPAQELKSFLIGKLQ